MTSNGELELPLVVVDLTLHNSHLRFTNNGNVRSEAWKAIGLSVFTGSGIGNFQVRFFSCKYYAVIVFEYLST